MKTQNIKYLKLVTQARGILKDIDVSKSVIADLAIKACTIKLGGHITGFYSVSQFGEDIGVNRKTLSYWIHNRKVQLTLKKAKIKINDESKLNKIRIALRDDTRNNVGENKCTKWSSVKLVKAALKRVDAEPEEDRRVRLILTRVGTIKFLLRTYVLKELDQKQLYQLRDLLKECLALIDKGLK